MQKYYTIIEGGIPIGCFIDEQDRDRAFEEIIKEKRRFAIKGVKNV